MTIWRWWMLWKGEKISDLPPCLSDWLMLSKTLENTWLTLFVSERRKNGSFSYCMHLWKTLQNIRWFVKRLKGSFQELQLNCSGLLLCSSNYHINFCKSCNSTELGWWLLIKKIFISHLEFWACLSPYCSQFSVWLFISTQVQTPVTLVCQFYPYCDVKCFSRCSERWEKGNGSPFKS